MLNRIAGPVPAGPVLRLITEAVCLALNASPRNHRFEAGAALVTILQ